MRCVWCVQTHLRKLFSMEKSEEIERAGMNVLPIEEIVVSDDDWVADGCEAPL